MSILAKIQSLTYTFIITYLNFFITAGFYIAYALFVQSIPCDTRSMTVGLCGAGKIFAWVTLAIMYLSYWVALRFFHPKRPYIFSLIFILVPLIVRFLLNNPK